MSLWTRDLSIATARHANHCSAIHMSSLYIVSAGYHHIVIISRFWTQTQIGQSYRIVCRGASLSVCRSHLLFVQHTSLHHQAHPQTDRRTDRQTAGRTDGQQEVRTRRARVRRASVFWNRNFVTFSLKPTETHQRCRQTRQTSDTDSAPPRTSVYSTTRVGSQHLYLYLLDYTLCVLIMAYFAAKFCSLSDFACVNYIDRDVAIIVHRELC